MGERPHRFLQRGYWIHPVAVEDIDILKSHPIQRLIERGEEIFPGAPVTIGAGPHGVAGLGGDDQFISIGLEIGCEHLAEVALSGARWRSVVIGQIEMGHPEIEGPQNDIPCRLEGVDISEIMPKPKGNSGKQESGSAAPGEKIGTGVAVGIGKIGHGGENEYVPESGRMTFPPSPSSKNPHLERHLLAG